MNIVKNRIFFLITVLTICATAFGQTKTNIQSIARTLAAWVPEINEQYDHTHSNDDHYLYRSAQDAEYGDKNLQMYWYERTTDSNDWILASYNYHIDSWLKCFTFDRKTGALKEIDLPFTIPSAYEFDKEEFDQEQTYWRSDYTICENGDVVISASPSMNAICVTLAQWDKKGSFTIFKRGIESSHEESVEVWEDFDLSEYNENLVFAKSNGKTGIINRVSNEVVVPLIYDEFTNSGWEKEWGFCKEGKWGLMLPDNQIIIPAEYDDIGVFRGDYDDNNDFIGAGLAPVKRNGKWGFVNRNNTLVVPFKYDKVQQGFGETLYGEVAFVWIDGNLFWIDTNGNENTPDDHINFKE